MPRYSASARSTGAGSTTLPVFSLYAAAAVAASVREISVFGTVTTSVILKIARVSSTGTQGAAITPGQYDLASAAAACSPRQTHTAGPTIGNTLRTFTLPAAVGGGYIFTFGETGIVIPVGTGNGICVVPVSGTGQIVDFSIDWDE